MSSYVKTDLNYIFNPAAGTISFAGNTGFNPAYIKSIVDLTQGIFIYLPGVVGFGGSWDEADATLTPTVNISGCASTDTLVIQYDDQKAALHKIEHILSGVVANSVGVQHSELLFRILLKLDEIARTLQDAHGTSPHADITGNT